MDNSCLHVVSRLRAQGYNVKGTSIPEDGFPEKNVVYVDGHHSELYIYGHIRLILGLWQNPETELTLLPPEVFFG